MPDANRTRRPMPYPRTAENKDRFGTVLTVLVFAAGPIAMISFVYGVTHGR